MKKIAFISLTLSLAIIACGNRSNSVNSVTIDKDTHIDEYAVLQNKHPKSNKLQENLEGDVIVISEAEFKELITKIDDPKGFQYLGQTPCIVEFYADWCRPCVALGQLMNDIAPDYKGKVIFYKLNVDRAREVAMAFNVKSIPMVVYFKPRGEIITTLGLQSKEDFKKTIDMNLLLQ